MQGAGGDVHLADYNRNQCCADESASASPASAHSLGSARWRAGPSPVVGDAVRSGAKPRRVMSNLGTGGTADARVHTAINGDTDRAHSMDSQGAVICMYSVRSVG